MYLLINTCHVLPISTCVMYFLSIYPLLYMYFSALRNVAMKNTLTYLFCLIDVIL